MRNGSGSGIKSPAAASTTGLSFTYETQNQKTELNKTELLLKRT
jgi:hypothetical protein